MTNSHELDLDLKPWAAYVVGHHLYFVRLEQERHWRKVSWHGTEVSLWEWGLFEEGVKGIDEALRVLVPGGQVNAAALVEMHRAKDAFVAICAEQQACPERIDEDVRLPPGGTEWGHMIAFSEQVLTLGEELEMWRRFGAEVGRSQMRLWEASPICNREPVLDEGGELLVLAGGLTAAGGNGFLLQLAAEVDKDFSLTPSGSPPAARWKAIEHSHLGLARLDLASCAMLRKQTAPEYVLVLDKDSITFYGETVPLSHFTDAERACLWVLAENANKNVERSVLTETAYLASEYNVKSHISRMRKKIKDIVETDRQRTGRGLPPAYEQHGFIEAGDSGKFKYCAYRLLIDPGLVKIKAPRP